MYDLKYTKGNKIIGIALREGSIYEELLYSKEGNKLCSVSKENKKEKMQYIETTMKSTAKSCMNLVYLLPIRYSLTEKTI